MKSLHLSIEESLKKLRTSYIDILYVHWVRVVYNNTVYVFTPLWQWDYQTSVEEVMNGLHGLVMAGKVFYLVSHTPSYLRLHPLNAIPLAQGISDAPAWIVSRANQYARDHGKTPFSIYQGQWNVMMRDLEREVIPMARAEGMALAPWNVLGAGKIRSDAQERARHMSGEKGEPRVLSIAALTTCADA